MQGLPLPPLAVVRISFADDSQVPDTVRLRGTIGARLRRSACLSPARCRTACFQPGFCLYGRIFEPTEPTRSDIFHLPRPFALRAVAPGAAEVVVTGPAFEYFAYLAMAMAFPERDKAPLSIRCMTDHTGNVLFQGEEGRIRLAPSPFTAEDLDRQAARLSRTSGLRLWARSPLRIVRNGRTLRDIGADDLVVAALRRWESWVQAYGTTPWPPWPRGVRGWAERTVRLKPQGVVLRQRVRFSRRQGQEHVLEGLMGSWVLEGDVAAVARIVAFALAVQIGKGTTFGQGHIAAEDGEEML